MNDNQPMLEEENKIEALLNQVGGQNKYQYFIFSIFALKWIIAAMILFSLNFFFYVPDFQCTPKEMADYSTCDQFVCSYDNQQLWYDHLKPPLKKSIALDFGIIMVCSKQWVSSLLQSTCYLGSLIGYIIISHIADNKGRKIGETIAWVICIVGQVITLLSVNVEMVGIGLFLMGFGVNGAINIHYSFFKELVLGKTRERMIIAIQLAFSLGVSLISLLSYLFDNWKYVLGFFILIPSVIALIIFKFVEETPEFTLKQGMDGFIESFNRIAQFNNQPPLQRHVVQEKLAHYSISNNQEQVSYLDLFRYKSLLLITIVTGTINFSVEFIYDGTLLSLGKFGFNVYFNQILVGLVEIFGAIFAVYMIPKVERKKFLTFALLALAIVCAVMGGQSLTYHHQEDEFDYHTIIQMVLIAAMRFIISSLWGVLFVFASELFPNEVSSLSYGWISIVGTVGASISPYIRLVTADMTMFLMAVMSALMIILVRKLKQTKGCIIRTRILQRQQQSEQHKSQENKASILSANN